jgi:hypothetical protein
LQVDELAVEVEKRIVSTEKSGAERHIMGWTCCKLAMMRWIHITFGLDEDTSGDDQEKKTSGRASG